MRIFRGIRNYICWNWRRHRFAAGGPRAVSLDGGRCCTCKEASRE